MTLFTTVVWTDGDTTVAPVGPTSEDSGLLQSTKREALSRYQHAAVVPWGMRSATPAKVEARAAEIRRQRDMY